jgi:hypothetical protein
MTNRKSNVQKTRQSRKAASQAAKEALTKRNQPHEILQKSVMKRQSKNMHQRSTDNLPR